MKRSHPLGGEEEERGLGCDGVSCDDTSICRDSLRRGEAGTEAAEKSLKEARIDETENGVVRTQRKKQNLRERGGRRAG